MPAGAKIFGASVLSAGLMLATSCEDNKIVNVDINKSDTVYVDTTKKDTTDTIPDYKNIFKDRRVAIFEGSNYDVIDSTKNYTTPLGTKLAVLKTDTLDSKTATAHILVQDTSGQFTIYKNLKRGDKFNADGKEYAIYGIEITRDGYYKMAVLDSTQYRSANGKQVPKTRIFDGTFIVDTGSNTEKVEVSKIEAPGKVSRMQERFQISIKDYFSGWHGDNDLLMQMGEKYLPNGTRYLSPFTGQNRLSAKFAGVTDVPDSAKIEITLQYGNSMGSGYVSAEKTISLPLGRHSQIIQDSIQIRADGEHMKLYFEQSGYINDKNGDEKFYTTAKGFARHTEQFNSSLNSHVDGIVPTDVGGTTKTKFNKKNF